MSDAEPRSPRDWLEEAPPLVDPGIPPAGGWNNQADVLASKRYLYDTSRAIVAGKSGLSWAFSIFVRLRDFGISQRLPVDLLITIHEPPQTKCDLQTVARTRIARRCISRAC
jgi:hypothetical protein